MENEYSDVMSNQTDEQLLRIVVVQRDDYNPLAVEAAIAEMQKRGIVLDELETLEKKVTIENEKIEQDLKNLAGSSLRFVNLIIDTIVVLIITIIVSFIVLPIDKHVSGLINYIIIVGVYILYYSIMEIRFKKTIGKFITKTKVVMMNNDIPNNSDIITRSLCRLIPLDKVSFLFTKFGFHDNFSNTKVVMDKSDD